METKKKDISKVRVSTTESACHLLWWVIAVMHKRILISCASQYLHIIMRDQQNKPSVATFGANEWMCSRHK